MFVSWAWAWPTNERTGTRVIRSENYTAPCPHLRPPKPVLYALCLSHAFTPTTHISTHAPIPTPLYTHLHRPGSMPHLADDPQRARLEVNFRLLRHDAVRALLCSGAPP